jgi:hypothetical protein
MRIQWIHIDVTLEHQPAYPANIITMNTSTKPKGEHNLIRAPCTSDTPNHIPEIHCLAMKRGLWYSKVKLIVYYVHHNRICDSCKYLWLPSIYMHCDDADNNPITYRIGQGPPELWAPNTLQMTRWLTSKLGLSQTTIGDSAEPHQCTLGTSTQQIHALWKRKPNRNDKTTWFGFLANRNPQLSDIGWVLGNLVSDIQKYNWLGWPVHQYHSCTIWQYPWLPSKYVHYDDEGNTTKTNKSDEGSQKVQDRNTL